MSSRGIPTSLLVALLLIPPGGFGQSPETPPGGSILAATGVQPYGVVRVADAIGVRPLLDRLRSLRESPAGTADEPMLRQALLERVAAAGLEVDGVLAQIQYEREQLQDVANSLQAKRDRAVWIGTLAGIIVGSGMGVAGAAMQFSDRTAKAGDVIAVASGVAATVLSLVTIRLQRGGKRALGPTPNMLAPFFDRPPTPQSRYSEWIWDYMNGVSSGTAGEASMRQQLLREWVDSGRVDLSDSQAAKQKIELLASSASQGRVLTIDLIADRRAMLSDVGARVALLKQDLARLVRAIVEP